MATIHRDTNMADSAQHANADQPVCHLLKLAGELKNRIYREVLCDVHDIPVDQDGYERPALLQTCKQIRAEGLKIFYSENRFSVDCKDYRMDLLLKMKESISAIEPMSSQPPLCFDKVLAQGDSVSMEPDWANVMRMMRYIREEDSEAIPDPNLAFRNGDRDGLILTFSSMAFQARTLRDQPEELMERGLGAFRPLLALHDPRWMDD